MISTFEFACAFQGNNILGVGDNAYGVRFASIVRTDFAGILSGKMAALAAMLYLLFCINQSVSELSDLLFRHSQNEKCHTLSRFRTDSGKSLKLFYKSCQWWCEKHLDPCSEAAAHSRRQVQVVLRELLALDDGIVDGQDNQILQQGEIL